MDIVIMLKSDRNCEGMSSMVSNKRMPASALLDYILCPTGPGAPTAIGQGCPRAWRAYYFIILFHHFIDKSLVYFGDLSLQVTMLYLFSAKQYYEPNVCVEVVTTYFIMEIRIQLIFLIIKKKKFMKIGALIFHLFCPEITL